MKNPLKSLEIFQHYKNTPPQSLTISNIFHLLHINCDVEFCTGTIFHCYNFTNYLLITYQLVSSLVLKVDISQVVNSYFQNKPLRACQHNNCPWHEDVSHEYLFPCHKFAYVAHVYS